MRDKSYERCSLFLPFASLKGFQECLREKEVQREERKLLARDAQEELQRCLQQAVIGDPLKITYYEEGRYVSLQGRLVKIEVDMQKRLRLDKRWILLRDIAKIEAVKEEEHEEERL